MRSAPSTFCLLTLVCILAGCSQTGGFRASNPSNMKTVASVGDKPLPIVAGEPGASLRAETEELDRPEASGSRISGRVYDERGKPVPGAKVRLAVGSAIGGKVVSATTDRSGAFTLHGLRPGSSYTVIAEYEEDEGTKVGRGRPRRPRPIFALLSSRATAIPLRGTGRSGRPSRESTRSRMLSPRTMNQRMRTAPTPDSMSRTRNRRPPKPRRFCLEITSGLRKRRTSTPRPRYEPDGMLASQPLKRAQVSRRKPAHQTLRTVRHLDPARPAELQRTRMRTDPIHFHPRSSQARSAAGNQRLVLRKNLSAWPKAQRDSREHVAREPPTPARRVLGRRSASWSNRGNGLPGRCPRNCCPVSA